MSKLTLNTGFFESIIGHQALTNEYYTSIIVDHIKLSHFQDPGVRLILGIVKDFFVKRSAIPKASEIKTYLNSERDVKLFTDTLKSFRSLDATYNLEELVSNTEQFFKERAIYEAVKKTVEDGSDTSKKVDANETLKLFDDACNISLVDSLGFDYFNQIDRHIADLKELAEYIPTGWKWLDEKLGGGLIKTGRALYVIAGPTNVGKSIVLGNIATNIAKQGKTVLIVSLEMSEAVYGKRVSSQLSQIPLNELSTQTETLKNFLIEYKANNKSAKIVIKEYPPKGITVNHLKAYIQKLIHKGIRPDVIVLDYLNLMDAGDDGTNSYEQVKIITERLRALTYIFKCPIVSATQVNRCLHVNTLVELSDGTLKRIKNIKVGDVITSNNSNVIVKHVYPIEIQKTYKILLKSGKFIIVSAKHLFPLTNGKCASIDAGLERGDELLSIQDVIKSDKIADITPYGISETIDIHVSGNNLFFANGILTHNSGYDGKPELESTSESMGLAHTADAIIPIWQEDGDKELGVLKMGITKNRFGPNFGATSYHIEYPTLTLSENEDYFTKEGTGSAAGLDGVLEKLKR